MVKHIKLNIDELLLDENNPRIGKVASQSDALKSIIDLSETYFRKLMLSIKDNGLDPGDSLYIVKGQKDGYYVVLDGNRRLSAMKVLNSPALLEATDISDGTQKSLSKAANGFEPHNLGLVRCVLFPSRDAAHEWINRRHTGAADGEGRIRWGTLEIQRFSGNGFLLDIIDFIGRNANYSDDDWEKTLSIIENNKASTLDRILDSQAGRNHLGIVKAKENPEKTPLLAVDPKWAIKVLCRIIEDVRDGVIDSRVVNKATQIEEYFRNLPEEMQPQATKVPPKPFKDINLKQTVKPVATTKPAATTKPRMTTRTPGPRKTLAPKKHPFKPPSSEKGQNLRREAELLNADTHPLAASFVLRSFLELTLHEYMEVQDLPMFEQGKKLSTSVMAERVITDMRKKNEKISADLRGFRRRMIDRNSLTSIQSLNDFVHNKYEIPKADDLRAGWDSCVPVFIETFGKP